MGYWGSIPSRGRDFSFFSHLRHSIGPTHPSFEWVHKKGSFPWAWRCSLNTIWQLKVKNVLGYASSPPNILMAWCLTEHRDHFMFHAKHSRYADYIVIFNRQLLLYQFFSFLYCDTICIFISYTLMLCVQASLFDSSEKQDGSEVDLTKSKHQQTGETWKCAC